ncbi:MAG: bifunctional phosphopantothenoylcysteine decarboxylase/phosphopantothenate--cysteine ligase CoaBC [Coriobacteriia bacterium]|nr:bifunctional phosphopantothenoylcysteine decarboxylase/phosphopantothenate--cysteine ligase CoaBC [Coriobacteriia bacterium]
MAEKKRVLFVISGGIAAYKIAEVVSALVKRNYFVRVVMTEHALHFIGKATFEALSHNKVYVDTFEPSEFDINHIRLAEEADLVVYAPASANIIAKLACGIADDLASTLYLAASVPVFIAPAMNVHMYENPSTKQNMHTLKARGCTFIEAAEGYLACGYEGKGKLASVEEIVAAIEKHFASKKDLEGKHVLITAGPTYEAIDPVRFIGNRSSGKMGLALAHEALSRGAQVTLVLGPSSQEVDAGIKLIRVESAQEMLAAAQAHFDSADIVIASAAVSDMRPKTAATTKLKKGVDELSSLELVENPDIIKTLASEKTHQYLVGFAAETNDVIAHAKKKLTEKRLDLVVANDVSNKDIGFGSDDNEVSLIFKDQEVHLQKMSKRELASEIYDAILNDMVEK